MKLTLLAFAFLFVVEGYAQSEQELPTSTTAPVNRTVTSKTASATQRPSSSKGVSPDDEASYADMATILGGIGTFLGVIVAFFLGRKTITLSNNLTARSIDASIDLGRKATSVSSLQEIYKEYTTSEFRTALMFVRNDLQGLYPPDKVTGLYDLKKSENHIRYATRVSHFFDFVGMLVAGDLLDEDLLIVFLGSSAKRTWEKLSPYIESTRAQNKDANFQVHFEHLAAIAHFNPDDQRLLRYSLKKYPTDSKNNGDGDQPK